LLAKYVESGRHVIQHLPRSDALSDGLGAIYVGPDVKLTSSIAMLSHLRHEQHQKEAIELTTVP
jgi:hypothetical protein